MSTALRLLISLLDFEAKASIHKRKQEKAEILPGNVIVHPVSCLLVVDPVANENAGRLLVQLTRAQHAVAVPLPLTEAAFVHLTVGIPRQSPQRRVFMCKARH